MSEETRRALLVALALIALCTLLIAQSARSHTVVRWMQPDQQAGDRWEVSFDGGPWLPLEPAWSAGNVHGAIVDPLAEVSAAARVWRGGEVSEVSEPRLYVPEPSRLSLLVAGVLALRWLHALRAPSHRAGTAESGSD